MAKAKKIGIFFGSTTGNTEDAARLIKQVIGSEHCDVIDIAEDAYSRVGEYDYVIMGTPTWDYGEKEPNWEAIWQTVTSTELTGKTVAVFGQGDQLGFAEWYLDAMGDLYRAVAAQGARMVGHWPVVGYEFEASKALSEDEQFFLGLALDDDNEFKLTENRIRVWVKQILDEFGLSDLRDALTV